MALLTDYFVVKFKQAYTQPWWQRAILWLAVKYFGEYNITHYSITVDREWYERGFWSC